MDIHVTPYVSGAMSVWLCGIALLLNSIVAPAGGTLLIRNLSSCEALLLGSVLALTGAIHFQKHLFEDSA